MDDYSALSGDSFDDFLVSGNCPKKKTKSVKT